MNAKKTRTVIIGIGNEFRGDDAVGLIAARRLRGIVGSEILVTECSGEGAALMELWAGADAVILIDAVSSDLRAGTIHRIDVASTLLPSTLHASSSHEFGVSRAIELARTLKRLPAKAVFYGIEIASTEHGNSLSIPVAGAVDQMIDRIRSELPL